MQLTTDATMSATIAEFDLPAGEFALSQTISTVDTIEFNIERFVAADPDHVMPYIWITGCSKDDAEATLADDPSVESVQLLSELDGEYLYQMDWIDQIDALVQILVEEEGTVLNARGDGSGWHLRTLFPERDAVSRTYDYCRDNGVSIDFQSIYQLDDGRQGRFGLTDEQQDVVEIAFKNGYFDVPRGITLTDLADVVGISHQALSERLRRGEKSILENTVIIGDSE